MPTPIARLADLLNVQEIEVDLYRGRNTDPRLQRVYGGQVVSQALMAAQKTVAPDRLVHSLHSYFIRAGDAKKPVDYKVVRERDGGSFATRHVEALQDGHTIFSLTASFQRGGEGPSHHRPKPETPHPDTLETEEILFERERESVPEPWRSTWGDRERPFEFRPVQPHNVFAPKPMPPFQQHWMKAIGEVPDDRALKAVLFAFATDMTMLHTSLLPHGIPLQDPLLQVASLDHSIWFHAVPEIGNWLLFDQHSPVAGGGRGLNFAHIYTEAGDMVATIAQEGLTRYRQR